MIPILEDIIRALAAGQMTPAQALSYLAEHEAQNLLRHNEDRKYFAGLALPACIQTCTQDTREHGEYMEQMFARKAVECADALLAELAK